MGPFKGVIQGLYGDNGRENGNYYLGFRDQLVESKPDDLHSRVRRAVSAVPDTERCFVEGETASGISSAVFWELFTSQPLICIVPIYP